MRSFRSTFVSDGSVTVAATAAAAAAVHQNYKEKDAGKVVLYSTSMGIVRETYAKCANVKQILRTLLVKFEERDIFMSGEYQQEIKDRMQSLEIKVPQLFVDGQHIGVSISEHFFYFMSDLQILPKRISIFIVACSKNKRNRKRMNWPTFQQ